MSSKAAMPNPALRPFEVFVGEWITAGTHPLVPDTILHGRTTVEWMEGGAFLVLHAEVSYEGFPDTISLIGSDNVPGTFFMLSFDERAVSRKYDVVFEGNVLKWWRDAPGFSQRYSFVFTDDGNTIVGRGELSEDDRTWKKDLDLTYTRLKP